MKKHLYLIPLALLSFNLLASVPAVHAQGAVKKPDTAQKPKRKAQSEVAAKGAFPIIKASAPAVKQAYPATDLAGAKKLIGKTVGITGTVVKVYLPKSNKIVLLNFAKDYKTALTGAIKLEDFGKFPALATLEDRKVLVTGKVVLYKGAPEVEVTQTGAIKIIK
jgi:DNA/RNA endonuclease YhcR with UshA esterase domain